MFNQFLDKFKKLTVSKYQIFTYLIHHGHNLETRTIFDVVFLKTKRLILAIFQPFTGFRSNNNQIEARFHNKNDQNKVES